MINNEITLYDINDIQIISHCGKTKAYQIMATNGFPFIKIGGRVQVQKTALEKWPEQGRGRKICAI